MNWEAAEDALYKAIQQLTVAPIEYSTTETDAVKRIVAAVLDDKVLYEVDFKALAKWLQRPNPNKFADDAGMLGTLKAIGALVQVWPEEE